MLTTTKQFVSHRICLNKDQRERLQNHGSIVETIGTCTSVAVDVQGTSEPASEIFCKYTFIVRDGNIITEEDGYVIFLDNPLKNLSLLNFKDGGNQWLFLMKFHGNFIHQIVISGMEELENSMVEVNFKGNIC